MREIKLLCLSIYNFKGCRRLELNFGGRSAALYGDNAAGKTTVYDALTWLLFGKDSRGRGDFELKPLGPDGRVLDHGAVTQVEGVLEAEGVQISLRKTYLEKWSARRGGDQTGFEGNVGEYYLDGVPVKKYEYERRVGELVTEELFRMLTGVSWFCEGMEWQERRRVLFDVCGAASERKIMEETSRFAPLAQAMGRMNLDDYRKKLQGERRGLSGARSAIPARLDECQRAVDELSQVDFSALFQERTTKAERLERIQQDLLKLSHGALLDSKRNELAGLNNRLTAYIQENDSYRQKQMVPVEDRRPAMTAALERAREDRQHWAGLAENERGMIDGLEEKIRAHQARWDEQEARTFPGAFCPTCGQELPARARQEAKAAFEAETARRKEEETQGADREREHLLAAQKRQAQFLEKAETAERETARLEAELAAYVPDPGPEIADLPGYGQRVEAEQEKLRALEAEVAALDKESDALRKKIKKEAEGLRRELDTLDRELGKQSLLAYARQRTQQLRQEAGRAQTRLEELDRLLRLCDEFLRFQARYLEDGINRRFRLVKFRLFQEQVNGGLADCCEAMVNGVPYSSLNSGARVNAGLDVIDTLARHYGASAPLFLDNAESVTALLPVGTQVIRLVVSKTDKVLRCVYDPE